MIWRIHQLCLAAVCLLTGVLALQANLAGVVDWHKPLIGVPLLEPTPPSLVDVTGGRRLLAITRKNVLACLDAQHGTVVWRHLLDAADPVVSYHVDKNEVLLISGSQGVTARLFSLDTGHAIWEQPVLDGAEAQLRSPVHLGTDVDFAHDGSVVVLSDGKRVSRLDRKTGDIIWSLDAPGAGSIVLFKQILVSDDVVHVLALTSSFASQTLTSLSLSLENSAPISDFTQIPSIISNPDDAHLAASDSGGSARIVWFEHGRIRTVYLGRSAQLGGTKDLLPGQGRKYARIIPSGRRQGFVLGQHSAGAVDIIDVRGGGKILTTFENSDDAPERSPSVYSSTRHSQGISYSRVYWSFASGWAVYESKSIYDPDGTISAGYSFAFDTNAHGVVLAAAVSAPIDTSQLKNSSQLSSLVLTTSSGALQLVTPDTIAWTREESLTELAGVKFIELGETAVEETRHLLAEEGFLARSARHLSELKSLPAYIFRFVRRFTSASYSATISTTPLSADHLHRDEFGFQQLLVAATKSGKLVAMDSTTGKTIWKRNLGMTGINGTELQVEGIWKVRGLGDAGDPMLDVVAVRTREEGKSTVGFHVNALTGEISGEKDPQTRLPVGKTISSGTLQSVFPVPFENCGTNIRVLAVIDNGGTFRIFPSCKKVASGIHDIADKLFYSTIDHTPEGVRFSGHAPSSFISNVTFTTRTTWSQVLAPGEALLSFQPIQGGALASFGRVLGDKSTLYKYLNPHLAIATTTRPGGLSGVRVLDTTSGEVVYTAEVEGETVHASMAENWLVYAWQAGSQWRLASVELYEDREGKQSLSPGLSSFAAVPIKAVSQVFNLPSGVQTISFTTSRFGLAAKDLIYVNSQNQVVTVPRRLLDPRRPVAPPTAAEKEEMLIPYDPIIPHDPRRVISHGNEVLGVEDITTSPSLVESTPLILTTGLDMFLTRGHAPSGTFDILSDRFNKAQLLLTLAGLSVGIVVVKPIVDKKLLKMRWF